MCRSNSRARLSIRLYSIRRLKGVAVADYFGRDWTYRGLEIAGCNFSIPGTMWTESWNFVAAVCAPRHSLGIRLRMFAALTDKRHRQTPMTLAPA